MMNARANWIFVYKGTVYTVGHLCDGEACYWRSTRGYVLDQATADMGVTGWCSGIFVEEETY
jgi:hypothetical protein